MASEIEPVIIAGQELVLFVKDGGTANCYGLSVLREVGSDWINTWEMPTRKGDEEGYYCAQDTAQHLKPQRKAKSSP